MQIKILSPLWGHEHLPLKTFLDKIRVAGYDGIDTWLPADEDDQQLLYDYLQQHQMHIVIHQHEAEGSTFKKFRESFVKNLHKCAEPGPILINSHTGKDYFTMQENSDLINAAQEFSAKTGITVAHETHRGRLGYSPQMTAELFNLQDKFAITADFSHWVCVTESMLQNFEGAMNEAIKRSRHIHARVGFEEGPQVPDPAAPEWQYALDHFLGWWDRIVANNKLIGTPILPITTEFGPQPYMPAMPFSNKPVADQFSINCFMKDLLRKRYCAD
ncbi:sugar phosphate isomerase/epimerase family protein [Mucilaginibacter angelicae]|uniref:Sugar phosphate isomerase/epimerase family protein n=1 Tax=Mucilaginibacter angelicae TaxID=869718 RepID=A0ABV6KZI0_9SPHI